MAKRAITDQEIENCFEVMSELRTNLRKSDFVKTIRHMESEGYRLAFIEDHGKIVSVAGFRTYTNLFMGKHLYVDDLVTAENARLKGYGEQMVNWLRNVAMKEACTFFHLDSGTQRGEAHRFYFKQGFTIASYHFSEALRDS